MTRGDIVKDAVRRFQHLPALTIAKHVLNTYGDSFENDLELIRTRVRYYLGRSGEKNRGCAQAKDLFRIQDVSMPQTWRKTRKAYKLPEGLWLVLSDVHVPYHEPRPIEAAIQYGQAEKVSGIFLNGDIQDCSAVSYWRTLRRDFNREIEATIDFFDFLRHEFPKAHIVYKPGNHEYRLPSYYVTHAPDLAGTPLAAMETILGFEQRKIEFLDYHQTVKAGKLPIIHGHELNKLNRTVNPARGLFLRAKSFAACSHCHTTSEHTSTNIHGEIMTCWSFGCLCDLHPDYCTIGNDWNWGFALVNVEKNGDFEVVNKRILPSGQVV